MAGKRRAVVSRADWRRKALAEKERRLRASRRATEADTRRERFRRYAEASTPGILWRRHTVVLADVLQRVADGELKRVIVMMPPRFGKSELVSRLLPGWWLYRRPRAEVGLASYGAALAHELAGQARTRYIEAGGATDPAQQRVAHWKTAAGGGMWAAGVGGAITGKGADCLIIDDAHKNREEADSEVLRRKVIDWYRGTLYSRLHPEAALIVVGTRWHEADLIGWLLDRETEVAEGARENWHIVMLDQVYTPETREALPENCTVEPDWRQEGEPLAPEFWDEADLKRIRAAAGVREWSALHQQTPIPPEGQMIKYAWFQWVDAIPQGARVVRAWDLAGTEGGSDWTAGLLLLGAAGRYTIADVVRGQWSVGRRDVKILQTALRDGPRVHQYFEQESGVGGKDRTDAILRSLGGLPCSAVPATGSKIHRAEPAVSQVEAGNVSILRGRPWVAALTDEMVKFPTGKHDDQVDAFSLAMSKLAVAAISTIRSPWSRAR